MFIPLAKIFYRLLSGHGPFPDPAAMKFEEFRKLVLSETPPAPSKALLQGALPDSKQTLAHAFQGGLDFIALKALMLMPDKRYQTAGDSRQIWIFTSRNRPVAAQGALRMNEKGSVTILLDLASEGDIAARNKVWERFYNRICAAAQRHVSWGSAATPDKNHELAHAAFLRLAEAQAKLKSRQAFFGYLAKIVRNLSTDLARRSDTAKAGGDLVRVLPAEGDDPEAVFGTGGQIIFRPPGAEEIDL